MKLSYLILICSVLNATTYGCEKAMETAVKVCMKYADTNRGYKACVRADNNTTRICNE